MALINEFREQSESTTRREEIKMWLYLLGSPVLFGAVAALIGLLKRP